MLITVTELPKYIKRSESLLNEFASKAVIALKRQENSGLRHKNRTDAAIERIVIEFSIANPHLGQNQVSQRLKSEMDLEIHASGARNIWLRENVNTMALRLAKVATERRHL